MSTKFQQQPRPKTFDLKVEVLIFVGLVHWVLLLNTQIDGITV